MLSFQKIWWQVYFRPRLLGVDMCVWLTLLYTHKWPLLFVFTILVNALIGGVGRGDTPWGDSQCLTQSSNPLRGRGKPCDLLWINKRQQRWWLPHLWWQFSFKFYLSWKGRHRCWLWGSKQPAMVWAACGEACAGNCGRRQQQVLRAGATLLWPQGSQSPGRGGRPPERPPPSRRPNACLWGPSRGPSSSVGRLLTQ